MVFMVVTFILVVGATTTAVLVMVATVIVLKAQWSWRFLWR
jgi:hypothetical protein